MYLLMENLWILFYKDVSNIKRTWVIIYSNYTRYDKNGEFDTIYHEHISFFNTKSMNCLVKEMI